jgi:signal peptidase II
MVVLLIVAANIGCDQTTKLAARKTLRGRGTVRVVGDFLVLRYAENRGAFLSLGSTWPKPLRILVLIVLPSGVLAALILYFLKTSKINILPLIALSFVAGGGLSNLLDRLFYDGIVIDFMNIGIKNVRTGIFNFADLSIIFGVASLIFVGKRKPTT